ncbi:MAG: YceI family protein [Terriglobales bacterium]
MRTLAVLILASACAVAQTPASYHLLASQSRFTARLAKTGLLAALGDEHLIVAEGASGTVEARPAPPQNPIPWRVQLILPAAQVVDSDPAASNVKRNAITQHLQSREQLDVRRYSTIELRGTATAGPDGTGKFEGALLLHGVSRPLRVPLAWIQAGQTLRVRGKMRLRFSDFGITPARVGLGTIRVKNEFELEWDAVFQPDRR